MKKYNDKKKISKHVTTVNDQCNLVLETKPSGPCSTSSTHIDCLALAQPATVWEKLTVAGAPIIPAAN